MPEVDRHPVPGRTCGECNVCCDVLTIDEPELKKPPGILCSNCDPGKGCKIYQSRPSVCRNWHCGWRLASSLGPEWRPDRSRILISETTSNIPSQFKQKGLTFALNGDARSQVRWQPLTLNLFAFIQVEMPVFLSVPGPPGQAGGQVFLNNHIALAAAVAAHDFEQFGMLLVEAVEACIRHPS